MFILKYISIILSILGYILASLILYFGFNPLKTTKASNLSLSTIISCDEKIVLDNEKEINEDSINKTKKIIGNDIPVDILPKLGDALKDLSIKSGSKIRYNLSYCDTASTKDSLDKIEEYLEKNKNDYSHGSLEETMKYINSIPFIEVIGLDIELPSVLAKTKYCNKPINESTIYFFIKSKTNSNTVLMGLTLQRDDNATTKNKFAGNLVQTGQYLKHKLYCNG